jgi:predicted nucleic acid-binding protein
MNAEYRSLTEELFTWLGKAGNSGITSTISFTELLMPGYREGDQSRVDGFYALLTSFPNLTWCPTTLGVADRAAQFRGVHRFKTPDAVQAATAVANSATAFVTNDAVFKRLSHFEVAVLDDLL